MTNDNPLHFIPEAEFDRRAEQYWTRKRFLEVVRVIEPEVLGSLRDDVLPVYRPDRDQSAPQVMAALRGWATRWSLLEPWAVQAAAHTLEAWASTSWTPDKGVRAPGERRKGMAIGNWPDTVASELTWEWDHRLTFPRVEPPAPPPLRMHPYEPTLGRWTHYVAYAQAGLDEWLALYKARVERWAEMHGLEAANQSPQRARIVDDRAVYFEWLVRWRILGWTHNDIACHHYSSTDSSVDVKVVARHCRQLADLVGLDRTRRRRRRIR